MPRILAPSAILAITTALASQGSITDNTATFSLAGVPPSQTSTTGLGNFVVGGGNDSTYQSWWYYRDAGGNGGAFNDSGNQLTQSYVANIATLTWTDLDALGLYDAILNMVVTETGPDNGHVQQFMTVTNRTNSPQTITVYHYTDFDHDGTTSNWTLPGSGPDRFIVSGANGGCSEHWADSPTNWQVGTFASIRGRCSAGFPLLDSGLPLGSSTSMVDFTGAVEWRSVVIPPLQSVMFMSTLGYNHVHSGVSPVSTTYGTGVGEVGGSIPTISSSTPILGAPLDITVTTTSTATTGALLVGFGQTSVPVCGLQLLVNPVADGTLTFAAGTASYTLAAPCDPGLAGLSAYWQAFLLDNGSPACFPVIHSPGLRTRFGD